MDAGTDFYKQPNNEILLCYQCGSISLKLLLFFANWKEYLVSLLETPYHRNIGIYCNSLIFSNFLSK